VSGGAPTTWPWERLNESNASAHDVLATLLDPRPGDRWLDVGTGGGGLALRLARTGAQVVGVDVAEDGLEHARAAAADSGGDVTFRLGDAQELPFEDGEFDGVASAFGVIFAPDRERAASELARVCRTGGKLGLTLMPADSRTGEMFRVLARHGGAQHHPASWAEDAERLLGDSFELDVERRESAVPAQPLQWEESVRTFAPLRELVEGLEEDEVATLRGELEAVAERFEGRPPSYVVALGRRR
jgi:ubiquinone/menaquinone biosynthesis C-methylase UbiE